MENTQRYYQQNAQDYFSSTAFLDTSPLYDHFIPLLPDNAHLLDAGCGSGRDTKAFLKRGYRVTAFDACHELVALATKHTGIAVQYSTFTEFTSTTLFDGIWACASLLHVPHKEMINTLCHLGQLLKAGSYFYCSFKTSGPEQTEDGRRFTHFNLGEMKTLLISTPFSLFHGWLTEDVRNDSQQQWLNVILKKDG